MSSDETHAGHTFTREAPEDEHVDEFKLFAREESRQMRELQRMEKMERVARMEQLRHEIYELEHEDRGGEGSRRRRILMEKMERLERLRQEDNYDIEREDYECRHHQRRYMRPARLGLFRENYEDMEFEDRYREERNRRRQAMERLEQLRRREPNDPGIERRLEELHADEYNERERAERWRMRKMEGSFML
jgi:hypothetical protein